MTLLRIFPVFVIGFVMVLAACSPTAQQQEGPVVLAAASLQEALGEAADAWEAQGHARPVLSFAASSAIARQIAAGAPADIAITADSEWMDWLAGQGDVAAGSRRDLVGNRLVLIAQIDPDASQTPQKIRQQSPLIALRTLAGPLAIAEPQAVPAGRYARAGLVKLGVWEDLSPQVVPAENVRAALALVERGEADLGIVYASDAAASARVRVLAVFDPELHPPIRYPAALIAGSAHDEAADFLTFLSGDAARAIFIRHGFEALA